MGGLGLKEGQAQPRIRPPQTIPTPRNQATVSITAGSSGPIEYPSAASAFFDENRKSGQN